MKRDTKCYEIYIKHISRFIRIQILKKAFT